MNIAGPILKCDVFRDSGGSSKVKYSVVLVQFSLNFLLSIFREWGKFHCCIEECMIRRGNGVMLWLAWWVSIGGKEQGRV